MNIQYEVIEFYNGNWCGSCGQYPELQDAIEKQKQLVTDKDDKNLSYKIFVKVINKEKK